MKQQIKNLSIKLFLTIPAIIIGICSYTIFIYKYSQFIKLVFGPLNTLWINKTPSIEIPKSTPEENHKFI